MLYSPTLHGMAAARTITSLAAASDMIPLYDASIGDVVRGALKDTRQYQAWLMPLTGFPHDLSAAATTSNVTVTGTVTTSWAASITLPYPVVCAGVRVVGNGPNSADTSTAAQFDVARNGTSILTNAAISTSAGLSLAAIAGTYAKNQSSLVAPHASQAGTWSEGDLITVHVTAGDTGGGGTRAAKCACIWLYVARV